MRFFDHKSSASERNLGRIEGKLFTAMADSHHHSEQEVRELTKAWLESLMQNANAQKAAPASVRTRKLAEQDDPLTNRNRSRR